MGSSRVHFQPMKNNYIICYCRHIQAKKEENTKENPVPVNVFICDCSDKFYIIQIQNIRLWVLWEPIVLAAIDCFCCFRAGLMLLTDMENVHSKPSTDRVFFLARLKWWPEHTRFHIIVLESFHKYRLMVSVVCSLVLITLAPNFQKYVIWFQLGHSSTCTINYPSSCFLD